MKARATAGLLLSTLVVAVAPIAAEDIQGHLETPAGINVFTNAVPLTGWALADSGIRSVVIRVDGKPVTTALHGLPRADVEDVFAGSGFAELDIAGFSIHLEAPAFTNGVHKVDAIVVSKDGNSLVLPGGNFLFQNNTHILPPFGRIDRPHRNAQLFGTCDLPPIDDELFDVDRRLTPVTGWVLDLGVEIGDAGVGYVELLIDGVDVANTRIGCGFSAFAGGFVNCYGLPRLDIEQRFPFAIDAPSSGFRFVLDVGALIDFGFAQGHHTLTIRSGDISGQVANVHEIPVTFFCEENLPNEGAFGRIEKPIPGGKFTTTAEFVGWALDREGVERVDLYVDGVFVDSAAFGVGSRASVLSQYPGYPDSLAPVWRHTMDAALLGDGDHQLQVIVVDEEGVETLIGERSFTVETIP